ncbi:SPOR domain-containing protein [Cellulomonas cellasea]|uniref:SPOR domain-containing protein n=1 Tax=Cellulomonas cellasea TaxID=43670 RepID=UPI0025A34714|nr:SPOR domain-containing protein [Cellulomonas cellasea]MDM8084193.1 SPOR domain-containing protein [Cellulomonas cellasea]
MSGSGEYYYNIATGQVEEGKVSDWKDRMGPYPTREAAQRALDLAAARSKAWDEEDEERRR